MCCFRLHFSDFNMLFFEKIKNLLQFIFEKNNLLCKNRKKITCREEKSQPPSIPVPNQHTASQSPDSEVKRVLIPGVAFILSHGIANLLLVLLNRVV